MFQILKFTAKYISHILCEKISKPSCNKITFPIRNDPEKGKIVIDFMRHIQSRERGDCAPPPALRPRAHPARPRGQNPLDGHGAAAGAHARGGGGFGSGSGGGLSTPPSSEVRLSDGNSDRFKTIFIQIII